MEQSSVSSGSSGFGCTSMPISPQASPSKDPGVSLVQSPGPLTMAGTPTLLAAPGQPMVGPNGQVIQPIIYFYAATMPPTPPGSPQGSIAAMPLLNATNSGAGQAPMQALQIPYGAYMVQAQHMGNASINLANTLILRGLPANTTVNDIHQFFAGIFMVNPHIHFKLIK